MNGWREARARLALIAALTAASGCAVTIGEQQLLRPVEAGQLSPAEVLAAGYQLERQIITTEDGVRLSGALLRRAGADTTILYFGGNQFTVGKLGPAAARAFAPLNVNLMLVDHRGYGQSEGSPSARLITSDGVAVFDHLAELPNVNRNRIVVHGQSLGSFVAGEVAAVRNTAGVVLESSATTTEEWVRARAGSAPVKVRVAPEIAGQGNSRTIGRIEEPLLLLVGERDAVTPPDLSRRLFDQSPLPQPRKSIVVVAGATHNDAMLKPEAIAAYRAFLNRIERAGV